MSVIVVSVKENEIQVVADTQCTRANVAGTCQKLFQDDLGTIFGYTGAVEEGTLLRLYTKDNILTGDNDLDILEYFHGFSHWLMKFKEEWSPLECDYIVVRNGRAWKVVGFMIEEVRTFDAVGSGSDFALAALETGASPIHAVEIAAKFDIYCNVPVQTLSCLREQ